MGIDLYAAKDKAEKIRCYASDITSVKDLMMLYSDRLQVFYHSEEVTKIVAILLKSIREAENIADSLMSIGEDITISAAEIKHEEEVEKARNELRKAQERLDRQRVKYNDAVSRYVSDPSEYNEQCVDHEYSSYCSVKSEYDIARQKLRSLE